MKNIEKLLLIMALLITSIMTSTNVGVKAIDNSKDDLGILDTLKLTDQYGQVINVDGANMVSGRTYTLLYEWSLDEPAMNYKNQVATFNMPAVFKATSVFPKTIDLIYDDNGTNVVIGTVSANDDGLVTVQFNDNSILEEKSNIHGWISITAQCGSTLGNTDIVLGWNGNNEDKISVNVVQDSIGGNKTAALNKFVKSGKNGNHPIVNQSADGKFYITFGVEVFISDDHPKITLEDTIYAGMEVDTNSIKVISRPRDGQEYYSASTSIYKNNYDAWELSNPTGDKKTKNDITASLVSLNKIVSSNTGFEINFDTVDFDAQLASRQLATTPLQMRYEVEYDVFLTGIDPSITLAQAQTIFESQNAKNTVSLKHEEAIITETTWNKGVLGGGAVGETRDVTLSKVDSVTGEQLNGAEFNLYKQNIYDSKLWELYQANIILDNGSLLVPGLTFGNYYFEETVAPVGYVLPTSKFDAFKIDSTTPQTNFEIKLENTKEVAIIEKGALKFEKVDAINNAVKLSANFDIYKKINDQLVVNVTTDDLGLATINDLEIGEYYLVEKMAPIGYILDSTPHAFIIEKDIINIIYTGSNAIKNLKKETTPDSDDSTPEIKPPVPEIKPPVPEVKPNLITDNKAKVTLAKTGLDNSLLNIWVSLFIALSLVYTVIKKNDEKYDCLK